MGGLGCRVFGPLGVLCCDGAGVAPDLVLLVLGFLGIVGVGIGGAALGLGTLAIISVRDGYLSAESLVRGD